ncbi:hypothetical protein H312_03365 [Anncaliia algerae PRA339]|uniref:Uncharacterized protein n=1 Tax=Anncaliia algerae PRA339 TaxID=1288291 RepID=A0A059EWZ8_9MICR|nr:hypothetical protein H312_03365 [Anncaliia algerae PRA339]
MNITAEELESRIMLFNSKELIQFLMQNNFLKKEMTFEKCNLTMKLVCYQKNRDKNAWKCLNNICIRYKNYKSIRSESFFGKFFLDLKFILRVLFKYITKTQIFSIGEFFGSKKTSIKKIIKEFNILIRETDFYSNKLGVGHCSSG